MAFKLGDPRISAEIQKEAFGNYDLVYGPRGWLLIDGSLAVEKPLPPADLYFCTGNPGKVTSAQRSLGDKFKISSLELQISEDDHSIEKISEHKVRVAYAVVCCPVIADDSAFVIPSREGYPGVKVGRELKDKGLPYFLEIARADRRGYVEASFVMALAYFDGNLERPAHFVSTVSGRLISEERGEYPQPHTKSELSTAFIINGCAKTIAEMTREEYDQYARTDRWKLLKEFLEKR